MAVVCRVELDAVDHATHNLAYFTALVAEDVFACFCHVND